MGATGGLSASADGCRKFISGQAASGNFLLAVTKP